MTERLQGALVGLVLGQALGSAASSGQQLVGSDLREAAVTVFQVNGWTDWLDRWEHASSLPGSTLSVAAGPPVAAAIATLPLLLSRADGDDMGQLLATTLSNLSQPAQLIGWLVADAIRSPHPWLYQFYPGIAAMAANDPGTPTSVIHRDWWEQTSIALQTTHQLATQTLSPAQAAMSLQAWPQILPLTLTLYTLLMTPPTYKQRLMFSLRSGLQQPWWSALVGAITGSQGGLTTIPLAWRLALNGSHRLHSTSSPGSSPPINLEARLLQLADLLTFLWAGGSPHRDLPVSPPATVTRWVR